MGCFCITCAVFTLTCLLQLEELICLHPSLKEVCQFMKFTLALLSSSHGRCDSSNEDNQKQLKPQKTLAALHFGNIIHIYCGSPLFRGKSRNVPAIIPCICTSSTTWKDICRFCEQELFRSGVDCWCLRKKLDICKKVCFN